MVGWWVVYLGLLERLAFVAMEGMRIEMMFGESVMDVCSVFATASRQGWDAGRVWRTAALRRQGCHRLWGEQPWQQPHQARSVTVWPEARLERRCPRPGTRRPMRCVAVCRSTTPPEGTSAATKHLVQMLRLWALLRWRLVGSRPSCSARGWMLLQLDLMLQSLLLQVWASGRLRGLQQP